MMRMKIMSINGKTKPVGKKKTKIKKLKQRIKIIDHRLEVMYKIGGLIVGLIIVPLCILLLWKLSHNPTLYY